MRSTDTDTDALNGYGFMRDRCNVPDELKPYFKKRRVAAMHYERNHDACDDWTAQAYEHLVDALGQDPSLEMYLDGCFDPNDDSFEGLPPAFKRISKKKFLARQVKRNA